MADDGIFNAGMGMLPSLGRLTKLTRRPDPAVADHLRETAHAFEVMLKAHRPPGEMADASERLRNALVKFQEKRPAAVDHEVDGMLQDMMRRIDDVRILIVSHPDYEPPTSGPKPAPARLDDGTDV